MAQREADGRTWVCRVISLRMPSAVWQSRWFRQPVGQLLGREVERNVDQVPALHNATEAVAKQRELNVKSALIQELHHRVKNNLQNIAAILRMQACRPQVMAAHPAHRSREPSAQHVRDS